MHVLMGYCGGTLICTLPQEAADLRRMAEDAVHYNDEINASVASYMNITNAIQRLPPVSVSVCVCH